MKQGTSSGKRSRTGCLACKARKVKCDERPNGCTNCERLQISCSRSPGDSSGLGPEAAARGHEINRRRYRTFSSCRLCRSAKVRCSGEQPKCARCRMRSADCCYDAKEAPQWLAKVPSQSQSPARSNEPDRASTSAPRLTDSPGVRSAAPSRNDVPTLERSDGSSAMDDGDRRGNDATHDINGITPSARGDIPHDLKWALSPTLPSYNDILVLVEEYYRVIHPLRAFGFIHKPTFLQRLEDQSQPQRNDNVLLLVVCALGAKLYVAQHTAEAQSTENFALRAGNSWSARAQQLLFSSLNNSSIETAMAAVLLHEHELRIGNYASAFMITGLAVRLAQGLQINVETSSDRARAGAELPSPSLREARRRLMWSIYAMDAWVGSGVDELTLIRESNIKIQLPCSEAAFVLEAAPSGAYLQPSTPATGQAEVAGLDVSGYFLRLVSIRRRVLRYVKHLDASLPAWSPDSEYAALQSDFLQWRNSLPSSLQFTRSAIGQRKVSNQHGALLFMHLTYHQSLCDLTRIGMRDLFRIRVPVVFPPEQSAFLRQVQDQCFDHCLGVSKVLQESLRHDLAVLADTWMCVVAHDASRVLVHYMVKGLGNSVRHRDGRVRAQVETALRANLLALERMIPIQALAKPLYQATSKVARMASLSVPVSSAVSGQEESAAPAMDNLPSGDRLPDQATPEYVLNPLAIYRMATNDIKNKKTESEMSTVGSTVNGPSPLAESISPPARSQQLPEIGSPVGDSPMGIMAGSIDWSMSQLFPLPTSFDDLQTYMQLPLMSGVGPSLYGAPMLEADPVYGGSNFGEDVVPTGLDFQLGNTGEETATYPGPSDQNFGWPPHS